jgi:hypothetical protein
MGPGEGGGGGVSATSRTGALYCFWWCYCVCDLPPHYGPLCSELRCPPLCMCAPCACVHATYLECRYNGPATAEDLSPSVAPGLWASNQLWAVWLCKGCNLVCVHACPPQRLGRCALHAVL